MSLHCSESGCLIYTFCFMETAGKSALQKQATSLWGTHPIILTLNPERFLKHNLPLIVSSMWAVISFVCKCECVCVMMFYAIRAPAHLHIGKELNKTWVILFEGDARVSKDIYKCTQVPQNQSIPQSTNVFWCPGMCLSTKRKAVRGTMRHGKESSHIPQQPWKAPVWIKDNH